MSRKIVVLQTPQSNPVMLTELAAFDERQLQDTMKANPDLLPIDEFGMTGPLLVVGRETLLASGKVDLVALARSGELLIIEFKTGTANPDFRSVLAQLVDYGSDLWGITSAQFEQTVPVRFFSSTNCTDPHFKNLASLEQAAHVRWPDLTAEEMAGFHDVLAQQLKDGGFHYVAVAQNFTPVVLRTIEYMNASMPRSRFYAVEMVRFSSETIGAFESRTILKPPSGVGTAGNGGGRVLRTLIDAQKFLSSVTDPAYKDALAEFIDFLEGFGLTLAWGSVGTSVRIQSGDGGPPLSIGWLNPPGQTGWMSLSDLNFGFDPASAAAHPSLAPILSNYVAKLTNIPGANRITKGNIQGYQFTPATAVPAFPKIKDAISTVVAEISGGDTT